MQFYTNQRIFERPSKNSNQRLSKRPWSHLIKRYLMVTNCAKSTKLSIESIRTQKMVTLTEPNTNKMQFKSGKSQSSVSFWFIVNITTFRKNTLSKLDILYDKQGRKNDFPQIFCLKLINPSEKIFGTHSPMWYKNDS